MVQSPILSSPAERMMGAGYDVRVSETPNRNEGRAYHRPVKRADLDGPDTGLDPAARAELAHELASLLVTGPDLPRNAASARRFVTLAEEFGMDTVTRMWASCPPVSLPGALFRLYALRAWIQGHGRQAAQWYTNGLGQTADPGARRLTAAQVVAGVQEPPGPAEVARTADEILTGAFLGDFADALARASAFVSVAATGRAADPGTTADTPDPGLGNFVRLAEDLACAARDYRAGSLN